MKATEMIRQLQEAVDKHGDFECNINGQPVREIEIKTVTTPRKRTSTPRVIKDSVKPKKEKAVAR